MSDVVYVTKVRIERKVGPRRIAYLPGESQPVIFSVHGAIAEHYKVDPAKLTESHAFWIGPPSTSAQNRRVAEVDNTGASGYGLS